MGDYLFIDGGYLRERFKNCMMRYYGIEGELDVSGMNTALGSTHAPKIGIDKVFYYDCFDDSQRSDETPDELAARLASQTKFFDSLRRIPGWHVREGRLSVDVK